MLASSSLVFELLTRYKSNLGLNLNCHPRHFKEKGAWPYSARPPSELTRAYAASYAFTFLAILATVLAKVVI